MGCGASEENYDPEDIIPARLKYGSKGKNQQHKPKEIKKVTNFQSYPNGVQTVEKNISAKTIPSQYRSMETTIANNIAPSQQIVTNQILMPNYQQKIDYYNPVPNTQFVEAPKENPQASRNWPNPYKIPDTTAGTFEKNLLDSKRKVEPNKNLRFFDEKAAVINIGQFTVQIHSCIIKQNQVQTEKVAHSLYSSTVQQLESFHCGIFVGNGKLANKAAELCKTTTYRILQKFVNDNVPANTNITLETLNTIEIRNKLYQSLENLEAKMNSIENLDLSESGTMATSITCLRGFLVISNVGNSKAIIIINHDKCAVRSEIGSIARLSKRTNAQSAKDNEVVTDFFSKDKSETSSISKMSTSGAISSPIQAMIFSYILHYQFIKALYGEYNPKISLKSAKTMEITMLTHDHSVTDFYEMQRIASKGGITARDRNRNLFTKAFKFYKLYQGVSDQPGFSFTRCVGNNYWSKLGLSSEQEITTVIMDYNHKYIIFASESFWSVFEDFEIACVLEEWTKENDNNANASIKGNSLIPAQMWKENAAKFLGITASNRWQTRSPIDNRIPEDMAIIAIRFL